MKKWINTAKFRGKPYLCGVIGGAVRFRGCNCGFGLAKRRFFRKVGLLLGSYNLELSDAWVISAARSSLVNS